MMQIFFFLLLSLFLAEMQGAWADSRKYAGCIPTPNLGKVPDYKIDDQGKLIVFKGLNEIFAPRSQKSKKGSNDEVMLSTDFSERNQKAGDRIYRNFILKKNKNGEPQSLTYQVYNYVSESGSLVSKKTLEQTLVFTFENGRCVLNEVSMRKVDPNGNSLLLGPPKVTYHRPFCKEVAKLPEVADKITDTSYDPDGVEKRKQASMSIKLVKDWAAKLSKDGKNLDRLVKWNQKRGQPAEKMNFPYGLKLNEACSTYTAAFPAENDSEDDGESRVDAGVVVPEAAVESGPESEKAP